MPILERDMEPLLTVANVYAGYERFDVLRGATLEVSSGEAVALIGPNGAGKSTLLRAVFGIVAVRRGTIEFDGHSLANLSPAARLRRGISYIPQGRVNFGAMTVEENLELGGHILGDPGRVKARKIALLEQFPVLGRRRRQLAGTMSGGEQQQLEMAMALMLEPRIMLIDEPSLGLDPKNVDLVFHAIHGLKETRVTVVLVEQNVTRALRIVDRAYVLEQGQTRLSGPAGAILENAEVKRLYFGNSLS